MREAGPWPVFEEMEGDPVMNKRVFGRSLCLSGLVALGLLLLGACASNDMEAGPEAGPSVQAMDPVDAVFTKLWPYPPGFERVNHAAVIGDVLYISGTPRGLIAINTETGLLKWKHVGSRVVDYPPVLSEEKLYIMEGGMFVVLDADHGEELARAKSRMGAVIPPYPAEGGLVLAVSGNDYFFGVNPETGYSLWRGKAKGFMEQSTWDGEDLVFMTNQSGVLYALSPETHHVTWRHAFRDESFSPLCYSNGMLYVGNGDYFLYAFIADSGSEEWSTTLESPVTGQPLAAHGKVFVSTMDGLLHAVDAEEGKVLWETPGLDRVVTSTPTRALAVTRDVSGIPILSVLDAETGEILTRATAERYEHFVANPDTGIFYAITPFGEVSAVALEGVDVEPQPGTHALPAASR